MLLLVRYFTIFLGLSYVQLKTMGVLQLYLMIRNPALSEADKKFFSYIMAKTETSSSTWG